MKRQPELEQIHHLSVKTLDQVFIARAQEGLGCSLFEAEALTELVKDVYFPWLSQPEVIQAGQLAMIAASADEPGHKPLTKCKMVPLVLTLYAGGDSPFRLPATSRDEGVVWLTSTCQRLTFSCLMLDLYGLPCDQAVEHVGTEIHFIGPDDGSHFWINLHPPKEINVLQGRKHPATTDYPPLEVQLTFCTIGETQLQTVFPKMTDLLHSRKHIWPPYSRGSIFTIG